ncbi:glycoside hydrolase family 31 protein [Levilactobacillus brevis]|uniref:glycoside hydrolase family 31 protein n=1 Tax=Levilactobacillus brevis TaxID=1580 RepID=UPI000A202AEA|nr:glycoside hydrolase family 31 protein [Levilactobacillus brevis]ARN89556.1 family 31 glucosidase [Levilactobacillus brevis]ARN97129.1 family 31 glucosidase [Levilactobacillus brevis]
MIYEDTGCLYLRNGNELLEVRPWGSNSFRIRSSKYSNYTGKNHALTETVKNGHVEVAINENQRRGEITNGNLTAKIDAFKNLSFYNQHGEMLLKGFQRNRIDDMSAGIDADKVTHFNSALNIDSREFKPIIGGDFELKVRFESDPQEKLFGMGQYQQDFLNLKNAKLELAHRNSQASVPFVLSSKGYGLLWNNPAIGDVNFAKNITEWHALSTKEMDYWITCGDSPSEIEEQYANVTGKVPMMPDFAMGYWQCKLRYRTQDELLAAAREFKARQLPISVIVIDYFHWPKSGEYTFDEKYWPNPEEMIKELHHMGIKLMVSVWPTVDEESAHYKDMQDKGYLVQTERGVPITMNFLGNNGFVDFTNPDAQDYVWQLLQKNYAAKGVDLFWLDEAEPEYTVYDFDNYRYYDGTNVQVGNAYPVGYSKAIYDGQTESGNKQVINLVRCAWAGSQKYGALVWSGDIDSSFQSLRNQLSIGLSMGIAGIPWWTTDIGGFHGGVDSDEKFRELVTRWFEFATFCPVMRMHGDREPHTEPLSDVGGGKMPSGGATEPWAYGEETYVIMKKYMLLRENLKKYIQLQMTEAHEKGTPVIRPLFYNFSQDHEAWNIEDEFLFGNDILVAPVLHEGESERAVYLPVGSDWVNANNGEVISGGQNKSIETPIDRLPIFIRKSAADSLLPAFKVLG